MTNATDIIRECAATWPATNTDCKVFLVAVVTKFYRGHTFSGVQADKIITELRNRANGWADLNFQHDAAIQEALAGKLVIAGMTSAELQENLGHVAIVIGVNGELSGTVTVPLCYAGSLDAQYRVAAKKVSETFKAKLVRQGNLSYYSRSV